MKIIFTDTSDEVASSLDQKRDITMISFKELSEARVSELRILATSLQKLWPHSVAEEGEEEEKEGEDSDSETEESIPLTASASPTTTESARSVHQLLLEVAGPTGEAPIYFVCSNITLSMYQTKKSHTLFLRFSPKGLQYSLTNTEEYNIAKGKWVLTKKHWECLVKKFSTDEYLKKIIALQNHLINKLESEEDKEHTEIELLNFLESLYWDLQNSALVDTLKRKGDIPKRKGDDLGFYEVDPLRHLVNLICKSAEHKKFFQNYMRRRLSSENSDSKWLNILDLLLKKYIPGHPEDLKIISDLKDIASGKELPLERKRKLAGSPYPMLLNALVKETGSSWPNLTKFSAEIRTKIDAGMEDIAVFKAFYFQLKKGIHADSRVDFYYHREDLKPSPADSKLLNFILALFEKTALQTFFALVLSNLLLVPSGTTLKEHVLKARTQAYLLIIQLAAPILRALPAKLIDFTQENLEEMARVLLIQIAERYQTLTTTDAILEALKGHHTYYYPETKIALKRNMVEVHNFLIQEYKVSRPSCLTRSFGATPPEKFASSLVISAYTMAALDLIYDNLTPNYIPYSPYVDIALEAGFSFFFLISAILTTRANLIRDLSADYGRASTTLRTSMGVLAANTFFRIKLVGTLITGLGLGLSAWASGAPTANNDNLNYVAVFFYALTQYLFTATAIHTFLDAASVVTEHRLRQRQAAEHYHTASSLPKPITTAAPVTNETPLLAAMEEGRVQKPVEPAKPVDLWAITVPVPIGFEIPAGSIMPVTAMSGEGAEVEASAAAGAGAPLGRGTGLAALFAPGGSRESARAAIASAAGAEV